jgi:hypothetical protein
MTKQGYQAPQCVTCGHWPSEHKSSRSPLAIGGAGRGVCLLPNCDCREWVEPRQGDDIPVTVEAADGPVVVMHTPEEFARYHAGVDSEAARKLGGGS